MSAETWVFGYGSLMWDPGFDPAETVPARLEDYHRSFCMRSVRYRGTEEAPGLVLALDAAKGARCMGLALRVPDAERDNVLDYLRDRELITAAYVETLVDVTLNDGRAVRAITYVISRDHWQYARNLDLVEQARIIANARGCNGPNADYLFNTARHLAQMGLADTEMDQLSDQVRLLLDDLRKA